METPRPAIVAAEPRLPRHPRRERVPLAERGGQVLLAHHLPRKSHNAAISARAAASGGASAKWVWIVVDSPTLALGNTCERNTPRPPPAWKLLIEIPACPQMSPARSRVGKARASAGGPRPGEREQ